MKKKILYKFVFLCLSILYASCALADGIPSEATKISPTPVSSYSSHVTSESIKTLVVWIVFGIGIAAVITALCVKNKPKGR